MAFALISGARHSLLPPLRARSLTTPQASRHATDRIVAPPHRACDAGLRPGPFPDQAATLLPGLLAATRTGLSPAGDDELTNSKIRCYVTATPPALLGARNCWANCAQGMSLRAPDRWRRPHREPGHLLHAPREYESFLQRTPAHCALHAAAPQRPLPPVIEPDRVSHLDIRRRDRLGGLFHK